MNNIKNLINENKHEEAPKTENQPKKINKWDTPKNIPVYNQEQIRSLAKDQKQKIEEIKSLPKKMGRYTEVKKFKNFYLISLLDFLPFFLGSIYSLFRLVVAYGDAKRTINFNKKMMWDFKNNLLISLTFGFFFWPLLIISFVIFYPYIVYDSSEVTKGWFQLVESITTSGIEGLGTGLSIYIQKAVSPLFEPERILMTLLVFFFISMANIETFLFYFLFKFNRKTLFEIQKNKVREDILSFQN